MFIVIFEKFDCKYFFFAIWRLFYVLDLKLKNID